MNYFKIKPKPKLPKIITNERVETYLTIYHEGFEGIPLDYINEEASALGIKVKNIEILIEKDYEDCLEISLVGIKEETEEEYLERYTVYSNKLRVYSEWKKDNKENIEKELQRREVLKTTQEQSKKTKQEEKERETLKRLKSKYE